jgi:2-dehydro-3-deoxygalactonokinase
MRNSNANFLLVDWGTSNARAWLTSTDGKIVGQNRSDTGINRVSNGNFSSAFQSLTSSLSAAPCPTLMSGMIGSRQGWIEAPYLECPVALPDLARHLVPVPDAEHIRIVPGVHYHSTAGRHDVMRGEEIQIAGALEFVPPASRQLICLPGTHSKWALVENSKLTEFATAMTGEVFGALSDHTILGALMPAKDDERTASDQGFEAGLKRADEPGGLLHHLFGVRAEGLFDALPATDLPNYLSGILIGHEIRDMLTRFSETETVLVVGESRLASLYVHAITFFERQAIAVDAEQATIAGLQQVLSLADNNQDPKEANDPHA